MYFCSEENQILCKHCQGREAQLYQKTVSNGIFCTCICLSLVCDRSSTLNDVNLMFANIFTYYLSLLDFSYTDGALLNIYVSEGTGTAVR